MEDKRKGKEFKPWDRPLPMELFGRAMEEAIRELETEQKERSAPGACGPACSNALCQIRRVILESRRKEKSDQPIAEL